MPDEAKPVAYRRRQRISAWAVPSEVTSADVQNDILVRDTNGKSWPVVDDLSLQRTFQLSSDGSGGVSADWDKLSQLNNPATAFPQAIKHCHEKLGVQCLVGYGDLNVQGSWLAQWLNMADLSPSVDVVADTIIDFCERNVAGYDGVSFDLEGVPVDEEKKTPKGNEPDYACYQASHAAGGGGQKHGSAKCYLRDPDDKHDTLIDEARSRTDYGWRENNFFVWRVTRNMTHLLQTLARKLRSPATLPSKAKDRGYDRLVGFAAGGLIGSPSSDGKLYKSKNLLADSAFRVHDYRSALHDRNLLVRPMAYDHFKSGDATTVLDGWHRDIIRYATKTLAIGANFQLGCKMIDGSGQLVRGWDGTMGGVGASVPQRTAHLERRCRDDLSPNQCGLILFPTARQYWKAANAALNPTVPRAGSTIDQPQQCPLNAKAVAALANPK